MKVSGKKKVLVTATNYSKYCMEGKAMLEQNGCEIIENPHDRPFRAEELRMLVKDIDGAVVGVDTWDEEIFSHAPRLAALARFGVGVDNIDLESARKYGILVSNCPNVNTDAVAEQTVGLMLSLTRQIPILNDKIRKEEWVRPMSHELKSRRVGFLGFGAIARNVADKLKGFHPQMTSYDKYPDQAEADRLGVEMASFGEVITTSDIISIHLPATPKTRHIINRDTIASMKDGVLIINTARGMLVDEKALEEGLRSGKIGGVGTDVFEAEPITPEHPLFTFPQYIATPHTSAETYENCSITSVVTARALLDVFAGKEPRHRLV